MNCKKLSKIMPELASGETEDSLAQEAQEHLTVCKACADEFQVYQSALSMLSQPHEMAEVPQGFVLRHEEEKQARPKVWLKLGLATAACALVLALVLPSIRNEKDSKQAVKPPHNKKVLVKVPDKVVVQPEKERTVVQPEPRPEKKTPWSHTEKLRQRRPVMKTHPERQIIVDNKETAPVQEIKEPDNTNQIAAQHDEQNQMEPEPRNMVVATVTVIDPDTGHEKLYRMEMDPNTGFQKIVEVKNPEPTEKSQIGSDNRVG